MSNRGKFALLFLFSFCALNSLDLFPDAQSQSFGMEINLENEFYSTANGAAFLLDLTLQPSWHYTLDNRREITPYAIIRYQTESDRNNVQNSDPEVLEDLHRFSLGCGLGNYWRFIDTKYFDVLSGFRGQIEIEFPHFGDQAPSGYNFDPGMGSIGGSVILPLALEVSAGDAFILRLWLDLVTFSAVFDEYYYRNDITERELVIDSSSPFWSNDTQAVSFSLIFPLK